jgi:hypothetical protein
MSISWRVRHIALCGGISVYPAYAERKAGHGNDDWIYVFSCPLHSNHHHRKGLVTDVSGPQRNACPGTLTVIRGRTNLNGADEARGEGDDGADEFERSAHRNADQAERQQDHPDDRIEHDRNQRSGPADYKQNTQEQELHLFFFPSRKRARTLDDSTKNGEP